MYLMSHQAPLQICPKSKHEHAGELDAMHPVTVAALEARQLMCERIHSTVVPRIVPSMGSDIRPNPQSIQTNRCGRCNSVQSSWCIKTIKSNAQIL